MTYPSYPPYPAPGPVFNKPQRRVVHLEIYEGTDFSATFTYQDPSTYLPINLTGYTADLQVRSGVNGNYSGYDIPSISLELNTGTLGGIVLGGTAGTITVNITAAQTTGLVWNTGVYSLNLISPTGIKTMFMSGFFNVISEAVK